MLDRKVAPPFHSDYSLHLLIPQSFTLGNGCSTHYIRGGTQDVIKIEIIFPAGRWFEMNPGLAYLTTHLLAKGTSNHTSSEIAECFDFYGAHLETEAGFDFVSLSLYTLTKNLSPTLDQFIELLTIPVFPDKEVEQFKASYIQNLKVNNQKTSYVASKEIRKMIFGSSHPYGIEVTTGDISPVTQDKLSQFHTTHFSNPVTLVSGHFTDQDMVLINGAIQKISASVVKDVTVESLSITPYTNRIEKKGSVQSSLRMGRKTIGPEHPDFPKTLFVNHLLGGYFGSRLMKNIREEKGLTYGIYSSIHALQHDCLLTIGADVNSENRELAFDEIKKEIGRLQQESVSENELQTASAHFIGSLQGDISTPFAHADKVKTLLLKNLPEGHYQNIIDTIANMTAAEVQNTAQLYFDPALFFEVAVG